MESCCFIHRKTRDLPGEGSEGTKAAKRKPWDTKLPGDVTGPPVHHVGYDAARRQALLPEPRRERLPESAAGLDEFPHVVFGLEHVQILAPIWQAELGGQEGELQKLHRQAGLLHAGDKPRHPGGVHLSGDKVDLRAVLGQQPCHVGHGDGVPLRHHRDQHEVCCRRRCGHGCDCIESSQVAKTSRDSESVTRTVGACRTPTEVHMWSLALRITEESDVLKRIVFLSTRPIRAHAKKDNSVDKLWQRLVTHASDGLLSSFLVHEASSILRATAVAIDTKILLPGKGGEGAGAVEREPWDTEFPGDVTGPPVYHVGDDAARRRQLPETRRERLPERATCLKEVAEEVLGREHVDVLAPVREAELGGRERERKQLHGQAGLLHAVDEPGHPAGVDRGRDEADLRAVLGQQPRHVGHRDRVPLRHHRDQHDVRRRRRGDAGGVAGSNVVVHGCGCCCEASEGGKVVLCSFQFGSMSFWITKTRRGVTR